MSSDDDFSDDGDIVLLNEVRPIQNTNTAINRFSEVRKIGQRTLDGNVVMFQHGDQTTMYEEIRETNVRFGPTHHPLNYSQLETYIYPTNLELREYQFEIVKQALYQNVLCVLPTGLGKTFIASTVMLNFFRWTRDAKVIFMAPTRPLVAQQIKACYGITGIPSDQTAILLDKTRRNRAEIWKAKRVFFTTPQVVENDLKSGTLNPKDIVLLVVDEAHRSKGAYAYSAVVSFLKKYNTSFRVLGLSATPGSDTESIQVIVNNLLISRIEVRTEDSPDTEKYIKGRDILKLDCEITDEIAYIVDLISDAILPVLRKANASGIYDITDPAKINHFQAMEKSQKVIKNPTLSEGIKWTYYFQLQLLGTVGQFLRRLMVYGIHTFYSYFLDKFTEFTTKYDNKKSTNKIAAGFYYHARIKELKNRVYKMITEDETKASRGETIRGVFSHTKMRYMVEELESFFEERQKSDSKVIVFTELRESALDLVKCLESANTTLRRKNPNGPKEPFRPHIFIGQAKEKEKFDSDSFVKKNGPKKRGQKKEPEPKKETKVKSELKLRPTDRVGSSEDAQLRGMTQKVQKELIAEFKKGTYNILVATSIGEEGLDIGEVDMIICYDSTSSPIKNIQRMGRTGRKRDGKIVLLLSSNEREKFDKAMDNYSWIQNHLQTGNNIRFHKSDRIIPKGCDPKPERKLIEIPKENEEIIQETDDSDKFLRLATQLSTRGNKAKSKAKTSKKSTDTPDEKQPSIKTFFMPEGVETGFRSASKLVRKTTASDPEPEAKKRKLLEDLSDLGESDDEEIKLRDLFGSSENARRSSSAMGSTIGQSILLASEEPEEPQKPNKPIEQPKESILIDLDEFSDDDFSSMKIDTGKARTSSSDQSPPLDSFTDDTDPGLMKQVEEVVEESDNDFKEGCSIEEDISKMGTQIKNVRSSPVRETPEPVYQHVLSSVSKLTPVKLASFRQSAAKPKDPVYKSQFADEDGYMTPEQELEFYTRYFVKIQPPDFNQLDNPLEGILKGAVAGNLGHSRSVSSLVGVVNLFNDKYKLDRLEREMRDYSRRNQLIDFNDDSILSEMIVND
ncbi:hypothetical protein OGAPHI_006250 [Ogataea philodendri]|uniref:ATP-dependent DNA helicase n=1 Tax=Ogataea philodendri TaxID=1378263 RepID=A0A9P8NZU7_9ASCO|nr:uncharacterized protein OGAPHI_006250 [Ogataea philodendri]KAH3662069.1 hypothetical protein OGAPHI_006250 [Ogataea philodendri]